MWLHVQHGSLSVPLAALMQLRAASGMRVQRHHTGEACTGYPDRGSNLLDVGLLWRRLCLPAVTAEVQLGTTWPAAVWRCTFKHTTGGLGLQHEAHLAATIPNGMPRLAHMCASQAPVASVEVMLHALDSLEAAHEGGASADTQRLHNQFVFHLQIDQSVRLP